MNTFRYHFIFQKKSTDEDFFSPTLGKVSYVNNEPTHWEPVVFRDEFKPLVDSYNETMKESNLMQQAKYNLPLKVNDDDTFSFFHPNEDISFNEKNETVFNYAYDYEKSSLMNIDLDDDIMQTLKDLGADTSTVKGVQKFYEILGKAFIEFIENSDEIDDSEKLKLKNLLKT
jgi:hypothetical protein